MTTCPNCSHTFTPARKAALPVSHEPIDTAAMTSAELFAHYKRIAPLADVEFFRRSQAALGDLALLAQADHLRNTIAANGSKHTAETKRAYASLLTAWRTEQLNQDIIRWNTPENQAERYGYAALNAMNTGSSSSPEQAADYGRMAARYARIVLDSIAA